jgi:Zn-dependent protease with chaperone function
VSARQLHPLALPPATTGRFLLLVATGLAASVQVYGWLVARLAAVSAAPGRCVHTARLITGAVEPGRLIDWYSSCVVWASVGEARFVILMIAVFLLVSVAIFIAMPWWARRGLIPLREFAASPGLARTVRKIEQHVRAGAGRRVQVHVAVAAGHGVDRAFGRFGRYAIVLNSSRLAVAAADAGDPALCAVLRHEIAHLRNRDVDLTYLTVAVWWGFLASVVLLPMAYVAVNAPETLWSLSWRLIILLVLFWLLRASVLRAREFYADAAAGNDDGLIRTIGNAPARLTGGRVRGWFRLHPDGLSRIAAIHDTAGLFKLEPGVAAAVGALVGLGYPPAAYLAGLLLPGRMWLPGWACGLIFGSGVAAVLAGAAWRAALWAAAAPGRRVRTFPTALAFTVALMAGLLLTPDLPEVNSFRHLAESAPSTALAIGLLLLALIWVYLRWTVFGAACRLPVAASPRRAYRFGVLQAALVLGIWLSAWFQIGALMPPSGIGWPESLILIVAALVNPLTMISVPWICWYPLATWQTRRTENRRRAVRLWRDPGTAGSLRGTRTPLGAANLTTAAILAGYAIAMIPVRPSLGAALDKEMDELMPSATQLLPVLLRLVLPALAVSGLGLFGLGLATGGRGRLDRAVAAAGTAVFPAATGLLILMLVNTSLASPRAHTITDLVLGLAGLPGSGSHPANAALALMILILYGTLLVLGLPMAALGSLVRSWAGTMSPDRAPARPAWLAVLLALPMALLGAPVMVLGVTEWQVPRTVRTPESIDVGLVEQVLAEPWPVDVPLADACGGMTRIGYPVGSPFRSDGTSRWQGLNVVLTRIAAGARSSADATLRTMGEATVEALRRQQLQLAEQGVAATLRYCLAAA